MNTTDAHNEDQQTEERILAAAQRVFVRSGTSGASSQEIADEAGVNRALINYYFRSKQKLADAVFIRVASTLFPELLKTLMSDLPLREKIQKAVDIELGILSKNPYLPSYVLAELQYNPDRLKELMGQVIPVQMLRSAVFSRLQAQLDAEAQAGRLRPTRAEDLMIMLISLMIFPFAASGVIESILGINRKEQEAMIERRRNDLVTFIFNGLRPE